MRIPSMVKASLSGRAELSDQENNRNLDTMPGGTPPPRHRQNKVYIPDTKGPDFEQDPDPRAHRSMSTSSGGRGPLSQPRAIFAITSASADCAMPHNATTPYCRTEAAGIGDNVGSGSGKEQKMLGRHVNDANGNTDTFSRRWLIETGSNADLCLHTHTRTGLQQVQTRVFGYLWAHR